MVIRFYLAMMGLFLWSSVRATDTLRLHEALIIERKGTSGQLHRLEDYATKPISMLLNEISSVYLKNYGLSQLSGIGYRGTSSAQSDVQWNGMSLNSPLHGQSDLSFIPSGMFDKMTLASGSSSGVIGACIQLENNPVFGQGYRMETQITGGSFFQLANALRVEFSTPRYALKAFGHFGMARNNYPYRDVFQENQPEVKLRNADAQTWSAGLHQAWAIGKHDTLQLLLQYRHMARGIPNVAQNGPQLERQTDKSGGLMLRYVHRFHRASLSFQHAWLPASIRYMNPMTGIHSNSVAQVWRNKLSWSIPIRTIAIGGGFLGDAEQAIGDHYQNGNVLRARFQVQQYVEVRFKTNWQARLELKEEVVGRTFSLPLPYAELRYRKNIAGWLVESFVSGSGKFRAATLNDLFWVNAGNTMLRNEMAWCGESGVQVGWKQRFTLQVRGYWMRVNHQIVWTPNETGGWQPMNEARVRTRGFEAEWWMPVLRPDKHKGFGLQGLVTYSFNRSGVMESGRELQLIYAPRHRAVASIQGQYKNLMIKTWMPITGMRYVSRSNSASLPAFYTWNLEASYTAQFKSIGFSLFFRTLNVLDHRYEEVMMRPMPGRYFEAGLNLNYR